MTQDVSNRKYRLIEMITDLEDEKSLFELEAYLTALRGREADYRGVIKPLREEVSVALLIEEQSYKPVSKAEVDQLAAELDIEDPIEELLQMLD